MVIDYVMKIKSSALVTEVSVAGAMYRDHWWNIALETKKI